MEDKIIECAEYIKLIYSKICFFPEEIKVTHRLDEYAHFTIEGNQRDDGVLIGRSGATIQSLRLFVHAYAKVHMEGIPCIIQVKDHGQSNYNPINPQRGHQQPFQRRPQSRRY